MILIEAGQDTGIESLVVKTHDVITGANTEIDATAHERLNGRRAAAKHQVIDLDSCFAEITLTGGKLERQVAFVKARDSERQCRFGGGFAGNSGHAQHEREQECHAGPAVAARRSLKAIPANDTDAHLDALILLGARRRAPA